jgi:hypothetical protein
MRYQQDRELASGGIQADMWGDSSLAKLYSLFNGINKYRQ